MIRLYAVYICFWCLFVGWIKMTELKQSWGGEGKKFVGANPKQSENDTKTGKIFQQENYKNCNPKISHY